MTPWDPLGPSLNPWDPRGLPLNRLGPCRVTPWPLGTLINKWTYLGQFGLVLISYTIFDPLSIVLMSSNENIFSREVHVTVKDVNEYIPEWSQVLLITFITRPPSSPPSLSSPPPSPSSPGGVRRPSWGGGDVRGHRHRLCHRQVVDMIVVIMNVVIMIVYITNVVMLSLPSNKWYFWSPPSPYTKITKQFGSTSSSFCCRDCSPTFGDVCSYSISSPDQPFVVDQVSFLLPIIIINIVVVVIAINRIDFYNITNVANTSSSKGVQNSQAVAIDPVSDRFPLNSDIIFESQHSLSFRKRLFALVIYVKYTMSSFDDHHPPSILLRP